MDRNDDYVDAITAAYHSVVRNETNWMLLHYDDDNYDGLVFYADGTDGLEELKTKIYDLNRVFVAFYHEETEVDNPGYVLINYIPPSISGVRRAKALVHSRRIGIVFKKHQTMLTVDDLSRLTSYTIHKALVDPGSFSVPPMGHSFSHSPESPTLLSAGAKKPKPIDLGMVRRSFSETYAPNIRIPQVPPPIPSIPSPQKSQGMFGNLLRRMKEGDDAPPPPPPKDSSAAKQHPRSLSQDHKLPPLPPYAKEHSPSGSLSEFAVISHLGSEDDTVVIQSMARKPRLKAQTYDSKLYSVSLPRKWVRDSLPSDPQERERRRLERQRQRELEEKQALDEEQRRQEVLRLRKAELLRQEEEEENQRRTRLKEELRRVSEEKERQRRLEEEEEERKKRELELRKRIEREKRLEEHRKLERWRKEQERKREEEARKAAEEKLREEEARLRKIQMAEKVIKQNQGEPLVTGWVTIQFHDSLFWKRRYFKFVDGAVHLYRSPKDTNSPLETVELRGKVAGLKEWSDGYEDLEAIPFSFVIEFKDHRTWSVFTDSEEDKFRVLGLLKHTARL